MLKSILNVIKDIENGNSWHSTTMEFSGYSGKKIVCALQSLTNLFAADSDACYVEVGVFQGLTLLSVAVSNPNLACYGIDNFAYFDPEHKNFDIVKSRIQQKSIQNAFIINQDYEDALESLGVHICNKKIGVYFVDGPHDYRSQLMCLELALPYLHENAIIIIDDSNYNHVRQANRDFLITHPEYKLVLEAYTRSHPENMNTQEENEVRNGWWNGINIIVRDSKNQLKPMYPSTERNRDLFENEHIVNSANIAAFATQVMELGQAVYERKLLLVLKNILRLDRIFKNNIPAKNLYVSKNTYSERLPDLNLNYEVNSNNDGLS